MSGLIIRIDDVRRAGFCVKGIHAWFRAHGLDFRRFLREGMPAETLLATDDEMARRVVESVRSRHG